MLLSASVPVPTCVKGRALLLKYALGSIAPSILSTSAPGPSMVTAVCWMMISPELDSLILLSAHALTPARPLRSTTRPVSGAFAMHERSVPGPLRSPSQLLTMQVSAIAETGAATANIEAMHAASGLRRAKRAAGEITLLITHSPLSDGHC